MKNVSTSIDDIVSSTHKTEHISRLQKNKTKLSGFESMMSSRWLASFEFFSYIFPNFLE